MGGEHQPILTLVVFMPVSPTTGVPYALGNANGVRIVSHTVCSSSTKARKMTAVKKNEGYISARENVCALCRNYCSSLFLAKERTKPRFQPSLVCCSRNSGITIYTIISSQSSHEVLYRLVYEVGIWCQCEY